jgi:peptide/nickel transport system substrate-binding protein
MRRTRRRALAAGVIGALLLAACGGDNKSSSTQTSASATTNSGGSATSASATTSAATTTTADNRPVDPTKPVRVAVNYAPGPWDPATTTNPQLFVAYSQGVYDRILRLQPTPNGIQLTPSLASDWNVSPDGLTITFKLRTGVTFQDGTTLDANAVKANMDRDMTIANSTAKAALANVTSVDVTDPQTVVFRLSKKDNVLPYALAEDPVGAIASPAAFDKDLATNPVGSGPYRVASVQGQTVTYERFDKYWQPNLAKANTVIVQTILDSNARFNAIQDGTVDLIRLSPLDFQNAQKLAADGKFHFSGSTQTNPYAVFFNTGHPPFDNVDVRRAISLAIDRKALSTGLLPLNPPTQQDYQPGFIGYLPALDQNIPYDPAQAKALLEKAGAAGRTVQVSVPATDPYSQMGQIVQADLQAVGLNVVLTSKPAAENAGAWMTGQFDLMVAQWSGSSSPEKNAQYNIVSSMPSKVGTDDALKQVEAAAALPQGTPEATKAWEGVNQYLVDNPINVPLLGIVQGYLSSSKVVGADDFSPAYGGHNIWKVGIATS